MKLHTDSYDSYKKAEGEWSQTIPSDWEEVRVKDLFKLVTDAAPANNEYELLSLFSGIGVKPRKDMEARGNKASSTDGYWIVEKNDIVVNKLLAWMGSVGLSEYEGVTSPAYDVLRQVKPDIDPRYFAYLFRTETAKKIFRKNSRGIMDMRLRLYFDKLGAITVPNPSFETQNSIANYIDLKANQIDKKISLLKKKVEIIDKLILTTIYQAVTRGLNDEVELKDSDMLWNDKTPKHWRTARVKELGELVLGKMLDNKPGEGKALKPYLKSKNIGWLNITNSNIEEMYFTNHEQKSYRIKKGDLLLSEGGEVGKTSYWESEDKECYIQNSVHKLTLSKKNDSRFFLYQFYAAGKVKYFDAIVSFVSIKHLTKEKLSRIVFSQPELEEQIEISSYLDERTEELSAIKRKVEKHIEKLRELRIAIINDAITGKFKVSKIGNEIGGKHE